jgi:hypothetical protein
MLPLAINQDSKTFLGLIDSGSSHCFAESKFVRENSIPTFVVDPLPLTLIDGSVNTVISEVIN